ncbi:MAG: SNF2 family N-terminal domain-containing protein [Lentinula lateritia]|nr:MAG: SNF2 family N-terminal domain-containing protein [Lentinula lateritia]
MKPRDVVQVAPEHRSTRSKPSIFPNSFLDDVKPHPVFISPEENIFGKIQSAIAKVDAVEKEDRFKLPATSAPKNQKGGQTEPLSPVATLGKIRPNSPKPGKNVYKLFNEPRSHDYQQFDTTLRYSDYQLKSHQAYAKQWMADQEINGRKGGIVADDMGLGKTLQMLVRIKEDNLGAMMRGETLGPTLIVGPKSVLLQWDEEIKRFFLPDERLTCLIYHGPNRDSRYISAKQYDVVLTTYGVLSNEYKSTEASKWAVLHGLFKIVWHRLVLDEAHEIRNASTNKAQAAFAVNAEYKWCLTGTPLQNKISDLFPLFRLLRIKNFSDDQWFKSNIEMPITKNDQQAQKLLKVALGDTMLRRLKVDVVNGRPILELPELQIHIRNCDLSPLEREFYNALEARMQTVLECLSNQLDQGTIHNHNTTTWVLLLRLRQVDQKVEHAAEEVGAKEKCAYILEKDNICPLCRNKNETSAHKKACMRYIQMAKHFSRTQPSTKITILLNILQEIKARPGNEKTIIFSQFTSMLNLIELFLQRQDICFSRFDGTMDVNKRKEKLNAIKTDPSVTVILVSLMAGGTGLNFTECNNVVLFDLWWNPAVEEQAFARAHRMGQTKPVNIYKLVSKDTIEMRVIELQAKKKQLAIEILDRNEIENMKELSKDEISRLLAGQP